MKIAFIDTKLNLKTGGGSNSHLYLVASELVALGHDVTVITLDPSRDAYPKALPFSKVSESAFLTGIDKDYRLSVLRALRKYENQFDIYHIWNTRLLVGGGLYRKLGGKVPVVSNLIAFHFCPNISRIEYSCCRTCGLWQLITHHNENLARTVLRAPFRVFYECLGRLVVNSTDVFLPLSKAMAQTYAWQHLDMSKMTMIYIPIQYESLRRLKESHHSETSANGTYNILYVGRLVSEKGPDILIKAAAKLDFPVCLHIAGNGPQRTELELLAKEMGISNRVIFHGWAAHEKVIDLCLNSQLFIHPARWPEYFCFTVVEAMALGMPIVVADYGNIASELDGAALPFRRDDVDDLVEKIKLVHDTPSLAASLAEKAPEKAKDFDYKRIIPRYIEVYREVLEGARGIS